jgi:hypothetical protein
MKRFFSLSNKRWQLWLSLLLFFLCYWVLGWLFASSIPEWVSWVTTKSILATLSIDITNFEWAIEILGICLVFLMIIALISPFGLINIFLGTSFKSTQQALFSLLIWAIIAIILICWFEFFVRLSILFSAGILARLDLQNNKVRKNYSSLILIILAIASFSLGLLAFHYLG